MAAGTRHRPAFRRVTSPAMTRLDIATALRIHTRVPHVVRTLLVRDDAVGWLVSGRKRVSSPAGDTRLRAGQAFVLPRGTQWDVLNEPPAGGYYEARMVAFSPRTVERFHDQFGQFAATPAVQDCPALDGDERFLASFQQVSAALEDPELSDALREHRAQELLLVLAERGIVFAPLRDLGWADRVHRLVRQRPHADWTVDALARAFHLSGSTLQRRLGEEGTTALRCVREVRMESAMALLQGTSLQVSEIAARCGYDSHSRFTAAFRQRFGYAPSHLRPRD